MEEQLCKEPLDRLMQNVIAVRTAVLDEHLVQWTRNEGITQVGARACRLMFLGAGGRRGEGRMSHGDQSGQDMDCVAGCLVAV